MQIFSLRREWVLWLVLLVPVVLYASLASRLPADIPSHYGLNGRPDAFTSPGRLLVNGLSIGVLLYGVLLALPFLDTGKKSEFLSTKAYYYLRVVVQLFLAAIFSFMFLSAAGWQFSVVRMVGLAVMLLLIVLGRYMVSVGPNRFVGFRTPWTIRDAEIWLKTHRVGGQVMTIGGAAGFLLILILPVRTGGMMLLPIVVAVVLFPLVYSFVLYRRKNAAKNL